MQKQNVGSLFNQFSLHILGVVDHKIVHDDDEIVYHNLNKCSLNNKNLSMAKFKQRSSWRCGYSD